MVYSKNKFSLLYILIFIAILVFQSILQEIRVREKLHDQTDHVVTVSIPINNPSCLVKDRYFEFQVPSCEALKGLTAVSVIGRVEPASDGEIFKRKRLMITDIKPYVVNPLSLKDWKVIFSHLVFSARKYLIESLLNAVPAYQGGLIVAVVLGNTDWLVKSIQPYFEVTGTLHILAASGQNVALVLLLMESLVPSILPLKLKGTIYVAAVSGYVMLVGLQPSIIRASLMAVLSVFSRYFILAKYNALYGLVLAAGLTLLFRPEWVVSIGFILSVCATLGIIILYKVLQDKISLFLSRTGIVRSINSKQNHETISSYIIESSAAGLAAQAATFPILYSQFGTVQLLSFIPTTLVGWLIPIIINATIAAMFLLSFLRALNLSWLTQAISLVLLWLPADLFLQVLHALAHFRWGEIVNPWYEL